MAKLVEVTSFDTGKTHVMSRYQFNRTFGKAEGKEILAGYESNLYARVIETDDNDTTRVALAD